MANDPELLAHQEWLGYVQPVGLVVSPPALLAAQAIRRPQRRAEQQQPAPRRACAEERDVDRTTIRSPPIYSTSGAARDGSRLEPANGSARRRALPDALSKCSLRIRRDAAAHLRRSRVWSRRTARAPGCCSSRRAAGTDFDEPRAEDGQRWHASPHARLERLLRETACRIGLLVQRPRAPPGLRAARRDSGHVDLPVHRMVQVAGRPIFAALRMLLWLGRASSALPREQRLPAILGEPQVPERRLHAARRAGARGAVRAAARLPGGERRSEGRAARRRAPRGSGPGLRRSAHRAAAAGVHPLRRGPGAAARGRRSTSELLLGDGPLRAAARGCRALPRHDGPALRRVGAAPRRCSAWSTTAAGTATCASPRARATSSIPTPIPSSRAARMASDADGRSGSSRRTSPTATSPRPREAARARRRAAVLPRARRGADRLRLRDHDGLPPRARARAIHRDLPARSTSSSVTSTTLLAQKGASARSGSRSRGRRSSPERPPRR